jgi:hypothetical protein
VFTFLVGDEKQIFNIYPSILNGVSEPLCAMMTNGMVESVNGAAALPEVKPSIFTDFCSWAYARHFVNPQLSTSYIPGTGDIHNNDGLTSFRGFHCGDLKSNFEFYPFCDDAENRTHASKDWESNFCTYCGKADLPGTRYRDGMDRFCARCLHQTSSE